MTAPEPQGWAHGAPPVPPMPPAPPAAAPAPGYPAPGYAAPGYAAPGYPAPGYPAPGYAAPGMAAPPHQAAVPPRGLLPWALGLLVVLPMPFVGGIASGIAMATSGSRSLRYGGLARENARAALNWGVTYLLVSTALLVTHFVVLFVVTGGQAVRAFYPLGIPITAYFALSLAHLVIVIVGMVRASSGGVMRTPFAIPFLRA